MADEELRNPLQNEGDAFRVVVTIMGAAAIVIAAALLISSAVGFALAGVAVLLGLWKTGVWLRAWLAAPDSRPGDEPS